MKKIKAFLLVAIFILPIMLAGCKNSNKNVMSVPSELTVSTGGIINFARVENDEYYKISINDVEFKVLVENSSPYIELYNKNDKNYLSYDASRFFSLGESYNVKVKACANKKTDSDFTSVCTYTHTRPIEKVSNVQIIGSVLTWDTVEFSSFYVVKVVTPYDTIIYDYSGNVIESDDAESIKNADLTMYQFSTNRFDFSSILSVAGEYKFYINAVSSSTIYSDSGYTYKTTYKHTVDLATPVVSGIHKVTEYNETIEQYEDNFHLVAVVDANANAVEVVCDSTPLLVELNCSTNYITNDNNMLDINLNKLFISLGIDLTENGNYSFKVRSVDATQNDNEKYYNDSNYSELISLNVYEKLQPAYVQIDYSELNDSYILEWNEGENDPQNVAGYAVYVWTSKGVTKYEILDSSSLVLPSDFISVAVQVLAKGNYISSSMSEFLSVFDDEIVQNISLSTSGTNLVWTSVAGASYVVEIDDEIIVQSENYIDLLPYKDKIKTFSLTIILDGYLPLNEVFNLEYTIPLSTPTIGYNQGFVDTNPYLLTFTAVDDAIGYYVYLLGDGMSESVKIPRIFTSTAINLSSYIINQGEYTNYQVQIQAVADPYSARSDSDLTTLGLLQVSHTRVLSKPEFKKDDSGVETPVEKVTTSAETKYYLNFYGVTYADSYEVMINFNRLTVSNTSGAGLYKIDITRYMTTANSYTIMVRALPSSSDQYIKASDYNIYEYVLTMQLDEVTNIRVAENDGVYTLSFDMQENASSYSIRIVKLNDGSYAEYLTERSLSNPFEVIQSVDITEYVREAGEYYVFVTALANKSGGYYGDSNESTTYGVVNKLSTLNTPTNIQYWDESETSFIVRWTGDENADYYIIKVTDPNGKIKEYKSYTTQYNINASITVEGAYIVTVKALVNSTGANASNYTSSPTSDEYIVLYIYQNKFDYTRYSVYIYGEEQNFVVDSINDLKNLLWYHYLFGVDENYYLNFYLEPKTDESTGETSIYNAILALASEAEDSLLYNFSSDSSWLSLLNNNASEGALISYLSTRILELYPEMAVLDRVEIMQHSPSNSVFRIRYSNTLDVEKVETDSHYISQATDYGNDYSYLDRFSRRSDNSSFSIDSYPTMDVETTEQLLQAVQYGRKPNFVGDCEVAEAVYNNARAVLVAIINNNMSDLEKVTRIFDWLEYALNLNYYAGYIYDSQNQLTMGELTDYGTRSEFYLEGLFLNLKNSSYGGYDGEFYLGNKLATDELYAKAFTLLCSIEGIETRKINGEVSKATITIAGSHTWNKVLLDTSDDGVKTWYALDLTYSDNKVVSYSVPQSYGMSSHLYFLVSDSKLYTDLLAVENELISSIKCLDNYDYYSNTSFAMTVADIKDAINEYNAGDNEFTYSDFKYSLMFNSDETYQLYKQSQELGQIQSFILNSMFYTALQLKNNANDRASFEFRISKDDMGGSILQQPNQISDVLLSYMNLYYADDGVSYEVKVHTVYDSESETAIYIYTFEN